jgi:hypothetical protein
LKYSDELDEHGRRKLVENPEEQAGIRRLCELYETDMYVWQICEQLDAEKVPARGPHWHRASVYRVLRRAGYEDPDWRQRKSDPSRKQREAKRSKEIVRDKVAAAVRAAELREQGLSLRQIGTHLLSDNLLPPRGEVWHAASILDLLRHAVPARSVG